MVGKTSRKSSGVHQPGVYKDDPDRDDAASTSSAIRMDDAGYAPPADTDVDADAILPAYSDDPSAVAPQEALQAPKTYDLADSSRTVQDKNIETTLVHTPAYSTDATQLHTFLLQQAKLPPKPVISIKGTHAETRRDSKGKSETNQVTDFDFKLDLTPYMIRYNEYGQLDPEWSYVRVVENGQKALRGGRVKSREAGYKADVETSHPAPSLGEWTQRYCEDPARLRTFRLDRTMVNMNQNPFKTQLPAIIRSVGYCGHINITFPMDYGRVEVYSPSRINRWRTSRWIPWLFYLTFLWIFTWPYLWWATRRYAVVRSIWHFSKTDESSGQRVCATTSEECIVEQWTAAVQAAALSKRQGFLTHDDMVRGRRPAPARTSSGNSFVDGAVGFLAGAADVAQDVQQMRGWGGDS